MMVKTCLPYKLHSHTVSTLRLFPSQMHHTCHVFHFKDAKLLYKYKDVTCKFIDQIKSYIPIILL